jgi:hypothetical protein
VTIVKDFGASDFNPYDVTAFYGGKGTYQIRLTEKAGCAGTNDASDKAVLSNAHLLLGLSPRHLHTAVWTGTEMIVWGGYQSGADAALRSGGTYSFALGPPMVNDWDPVNAVACDDCADILPGPDSILGTADDIGNCTNGTNDDGDLLTDEFDCTNAVDDDGDGFIDERLPSPRFGHSAVWTGSEMIVWGGYEDYPFWWFKGDGGRYGPAADSWTVVNPLNAPSPRSNHTAVWTGTEMIIFGGRYGSGLYRDDGGRYDPATDSWTQFGWSTSPGGPSFGGRFGHTAVWDNGNNQMIVWGGFGCLDPPTCSVTGFLNNGGRYNGTNWTGGISTVNAPRPTAFHTAVAADLSGEPVMLVWGGISEGDVVTRELGIYYPTSDSTSGVFAPPGGALPSCGAAPLSASGDADGNGCTDGLDLMRLARAFGSECGDNDFLNDVDFDNNDMVNGEDLDRLITNFGGGCGVP